VATSSESLPGEGSAAHTCVTNAHWLLGDLKLAIMHPGRSCIECHASHGGAPHYTIAGTVNASLHDDDDCQGVRDVVVHVVDANGAVQDLTTNFNGNFFSNTPFTPPYFASLSIAGRTRPMVAHQTDGDCMSCHTVDGTNDAPGRIVAP
jgi:mono/diheme cytochrome c family protein